MERTLTGRRTNNAIALIAPARNGWRVQHAGNGSGQSVSNPGAASLGDAVAAIPASEPIHLALPTSAVLLERMQLPSVSRDELESMVRLQLEKTLPFGAEEVTTDFEIIEQAETESTLLALAINNAQLDAICEPMRTRRRLPEKITLFAMHVAARCAKHETVCAIFGEQNAVVLAVIQNAKLAYAETVAATEPDEFFAELPQVLLSAELDGVPVGFHRVQLDHDLAEWHGRARDFFPDIPVDLLSLNAPLPEPGVNLVPATWTHERSEVERSARRRTQLMLLGVFYLVLLLCAAGYVIWLERQVQGIAAQVTAMGPQVELIGFRKARWLALAPAIDPSRYTVEVLFQVSNSLPSEDIRITTFDQSPTQFMVEGEAPTAALAIDFGERLKNNPELKQFQFNVGAPTILPNEHAQFRIFGKL